MAYYPSYGYPYSPTTGYPTYTPTPPVMQTTATQTEPKVQSGFVNVRTVDEAKNYPVAPGNSITFKVDNSPYLCTKTMGFSQLDQPHFEKYRLVKEEETVQKAEEVIYDQPKAEYALKSELEEVRERIDEIEKALKVPKRKPKLLEESEDDGV